MLLRFSVSARLSPSELPAGNALTLIVGLVNYSTIASGTHAAVPFGHRGSMSVGRNDGNETPGYANTQTLAQLRLRVFVGFQHEEF